MMRKRRPVKEEQPDDELEAPPILEPEASNEEANSSRFHAFEYETYEDGQFPNEEGQQFGASTDPNTIEFSFVDDQNVQCGICGEVVRYKTLFSDHINNRHPEYAGYTLEDDSFDPYTASVPSRAAPNYSDRLDPRVANKVSFPPHFNNDPTRPIRSTRALRKVSQIRVNINDMTLERLEEALRSKMVEKMGRKVPVSLVDKQHARCGICSAVLSLNRKFEVVHLVRHFNAWHPSVHKCSGQWMLKITETDPFQPMKPLSLDDFAVIDINVGASDNLQCIWCGMFMDVDSLAMHFHEIHPEEVEVPKCRLCLQELVTNARFIEKFGENLDIRLPDEHHFKSKRFDVTTSSEKALERMVKRLLKKQNQENEGQTSNPADPDADQSQDADGDDEPEEEDQPSGPEPFSNSRMSFGKRNKPKRQFIMPSLRQAAPANSKFIQPVNECHWRCKLCGMDILAAVISAGAIRHYRQMHPLQVEQVQSELCKARLERISDGCMEFVNPEEIECLICGMTYPLHRPYNMCRAIRHLKLKHPEQMPEYHATYADNTQDLTEQDTLDTTADHEPPETVPIKRQRPDEDEQVEEEQQILEDEQVVSH